MLFDKGKFDLILRLQQLKNILLQNILLSKKQKEEEEEKNNNKPNE